VLIPVPCRCRFPQRDADLFQPGILIESAANDTLAVIRVSEESRYRGFWKFTGQVLEPLKLDLVLSLLDGTTGWTLRVRKPGAWSAATFQILDANGRESGSVEIKTSRMRVPTFHDRVIVRGTRGEEVGTVEFLSTLKVEARSTDAIRGHAYHFDFAAEGLIGSPTAADIDARLLLAWSYYLGIYRPEVLDNS